MKGISVRKTFALVALGLMLAGCTPAFGTAAVVGDEKISLSTVQDSVSEILQQRAALGSLDTGDAKSGELAQDQLRFHIVSVLFANIAKENGITVTPAEFIAYRDRIINSLGGEEGLLTPLTQNQIARGDFDLYVYDVLYQQKVGEKLIPGDENDRAVLTARGDAFNALVTKALTSTKITVNPRYGIFDPTTGFLTLKDYTNGALQPRG